MTRPLMVNVCPTCGHENAEAVKFCAECGEKLAGRRVYEPGDYHIFCRKQPTTMQTVVHVV